MYIVFVEQNDEFFITETPIDIIAQLLPSPIDEIINEDNLNNKVVMRVLAEHGIYLSLTPDTPTFSFLFYIDWKGKHEFDFDIDKIEQDIDFYEDREDLNFRKITNGDLNCYKIDEVRADSRRHKTKTFNYTYYAFDIPNVESDLSLND